MAKENNPKNTETTRVLPQGFIDNMGRLKDPANQPSRESKQAGQNRYKALNMLKEDMFNEMTGHNIPKDMIEKIKDKVAGGDVKEALDLLKIITPKDVDITTKGESIKADITKDMVADKIKELCS